LVAISKGNIALIFDGKQIRVIFDGMHLKYAFFDMQEVNFDDA